MAIVRRTTKSGGSRYDVRVRIHGRQISQTFSKYRDADAFRKDIEANRQRGIAVDPAGGRMTVEELAESWLTSNVAKRPSTIGRDRSALNSHILPSLGRQQLDSVRQPEVQKLVRGWSDFLAPRTVSRTYGTLRAAFAFAVASDLIVRSPCRDIRLPAHDPQSRPVVSPDAVGRIADAIDQRYRSMVWVAAMLGLRWGEVAGLHVGSLNLLGKVLTVSQIVARDEHGRPVLGPPKSHAGRRTLSVPDVLVEMLSAHLSAQELTAVDDEALVFPAPGGGLWAYGNFRRRIWIPAMRSAGLDGVGFHDLRRTAATSLVLAGVDLKTAGTRLGHSDPRLTLQVYAQATTGADQAAAEAVAEHFALATAAG